MSINHLGILSSPISDERLFQNDIHLSGDSLLLIEVPQSDSDENKTPTNYVSKKITYKQVVDSMYSSLDIASLNYQLDNILGTFEIPSTLTYTINSSVERMYIISAIAENSRAAISNISCYNLLDAIKNISYNITYPKLSATDSLWIHTSAIVDEFGDPDTFGSTRLVATQRLASQFTTLSGNYLSNTAIVQSLGTNKLSVASQNLVKMLSTSIQNNLVPNIYVKNTLGTSYIYVPSQKLLTDVSMCSSFFIPKSIITSVIGENKSLVASQKLVTNLSSHISSNFLTGIDGYVSYNDITQKIGPNTDLVASQSLVTRLSITISNMFNDISANCIGNIGDVMYMSPSGYVNQTIGRFGDIQVCESQNDIENTVGDDVSFENVFNSWNKNSYINSKFYSYDPTYPVLSLAGLETWTYDADNNTIAQTINTVDWNFYTSNTEYNNYDLIVRFYSSNYDDDVIGLVGAYTTDIQGKPVALFIYRKQAQPYKAYTTEYFNRGESKFSMQAVKQGMYTIWQKHSSTLTGTSLISTKTVDGVTYPLTFPLIKNENLSSILTSYESIIDTKGTEGEGGWGNFPGGSIIKISKRGNYISAWTTRFPTTNNPTWDNYNLSNDTVPAISDLNDKDMLTAEFKPNNELSDFYNKPVGIGFLSFSQADSRYEILKFLNQTAIVYLPTNEISVYNMESDRYEKLPDTLPIEYIGSGRMVNNQFTKKTFYTTQNSFVKIFQP